MSVKRLCYRDEAMDVDNNDDEKSQSSNRISINSLNYHCLTLIFSYLPITQIREMKKVCYHWKEACRQFPWHEITTFDCHNHRRALLSKRSPRGIFSRTMYHVGRYLTDLTLSDIYDSHIMPIVYEYCENLVKLTVDFDWNYSDHFRNIGLDLPKLKSIHIHGLNLKKDTSPYYHYEEISAYDYLRDLPAEIHEIILTEKEADYSLKLCSETIQFDLGLDKFIALRRLKLEGCRIKCYVVRELLCKETLVNLELEGCSFGEEEDDYEDDEAQRVRQLPINLPNLEHLSLRSMASEMFEDEELIKILDSSSSIMKHLDLSKSYCASSTGRKLADLENLTYLNLENVKSIDDSVIHGIAHGCSKLKHLNINYRSWRTTDVREGLTTAGLKDIAYLENLEVLFAQNIKNIDDSVIYEITKNCKKMTELSLDDCSGISVAGLGELNNLNLLESLSLCNLNKLDDVAISKITKNCTKIKELVLNKCTGITAAGLRELANLKDLEVLGLKDQGNIDDETIFQIVKNCKQLNNLTITVSDHVSTLCELTKLANLKVLVLEEFTIDKTLFSSIAKNCKKLKTLRLKYNNSDRYCPSFLFLLLIKSCLDLEYLCIPNVRISVKVLKNAIRARKKRANNTVLKMSIGYMAKKAFKRLGEKSTSLKLTCDD